MWFYTPSMQNISPFILKVRFMQLFLVVTYCMYSTECTTACTSTVSPRCELKAKFHGFNKGEKVTKIEEIYL